MEPMDSKYHVGDEVRIGDVRQCIYGYNKHMEDMSGTVKKIGKVQWDRSNNVYMYKLQDDHGQWTCDDTCFEQDIPYELPEFDVSGADIALLLS